jgi:protein arginine kinase activator
MKKCDQCDSEATVHEVTVRNGVKIERHLCESCAAAQGIATQATSPLNEIIKHYVLSHGLTPSAPVTGRASACPTCKTTFNEFRQHGLLGCPDCYRAFETQLGPLLERAHDGGVKHAGKLPKRLTGTAATPHPAPARPAVTLDDREARLRKIRRQLQSAIAAEKYEEAAKLRDELKKISEPGTGTPGPA